jgi:transcriptional regulator with XRE-family HTH domain
MRKKANIEDYNYNSAFPTRLRSLMDRDKTTLRKMGEICDVSYSVVSKWRNGEVRPDITSLRRIAEFYEVPSDYLLGFIDDFTIYKTCEEFGATLTGDMRDVAAHLFNALSYIGDISPNEICAQISADNLNTWTTTVRDLVFGEIKTATNIITTYIRRT